MSETEEPVAAAADEEPAPEENLEEEEDFVPPGGATEVKLFGKWSFDDIEVRDISLEVCYFLFVFHVFISLDDQ
jgi:small subunit ribosomal protein S5e